MKKSVPLSFAFNQKNLPHGASYFVYDQIQKSAYIITSSGETVSLKDVSTEDLTTLKTQLQSYTDTKLSAVFTYKGNKASIDLLPTNAKVGDVYIVDTKQYAYTGSSWQELGPLFNFSNFAIKSQVASSLLLKANTTDVYTKSEIDNSLSSKVDKVNGKSLIDDVEITRLASITNYDDSSIRSILSGKAEKTQIPLSTSQLTNDSGFLTAHQSLTGKIDIVENSTSGNIPLLNSNGNIFDSNKYIGDATLGYVISGDVLTNNIKNELGITDQNFSVFIGRHNGGTIYPNFDCDLVYLHTNGYGIHRYLQNGENTWKTYKSDNATDGIFKYNVTENSPDGTTAQLLLDQLPTEYGIVGAAGTDEKYNNPITGNFILKIKTLSDNVVHEFEAGIFYSDKIIATEKAVKDEIQKLADVTDTKVDKVQGMSLISDDQIARLYNVQSYDDTQIRSAISGKVDKVQNKGLSTNDYTTEQKEKLASLTNYDDTALASSIVTAKNEVLSSSLQIDGSNALNKVLVISEKTTQPLGARDIQKHKMTIEANPVGYGIFSFNYTDSQNTTYSTSLQLDSTSNQIAVKSTTLSGYGITDAKIENDTITLGNNSITPLTTHQDISNKLDLLPSGYANQFASIQNNGTLTYSGKTAGSETLGNLITNQQLTQNVIEQLGITNNENYTFTIEVGAAHSAQISEEYIYDGIHVESYGDQNGLSLYYDQGEWKKTTVAFFPNDLYDTFIYKKGQEELSAQILVDELPTDGSLKNAGINFQTNDIIGTTSATIKIKTLSDNVIHEFVVGRVYNTNTLATEIAVKNAIPLSTSQLINDSDFISSYVTCSKIPESVNIHGTTLEFCTDMMDADKGNAQVGMMYIGTVYMTDLPLDMQRENWSTLQKQCEILVKVIGNGVLELELTSTSARERYWKAMYYNQSGMTYGNTVCPWFACLMTPVSGYYQADPTDVLLKKEYIGASQKYVDDLVSSSISSKITSADIPTNVSVFANDAHYITSAYLTAENTSYQNSTVKAILDQVQTQLSSKLDTQSDPIFVSMSGQFVTREELSTLVSGMLPTMLSSQFASINANFEAISAALQANNISVQLNNIVLTSYIQPAPELDYPSLDDLQE